MHSLPRVVPARAWLCERRRIKDRHCEPTGRANARPMTGSAKQSILPSKERVDCFVASAPRNDGRPASRSRRGNLLNVIASEAKQSILPSKEEAIHLAEQRKSGLLRRLRSSQ